MEILLAFILSAIGLFPRSSEIPVVGNAVILPEESFPKELILKNISSGILLAVPVQKRKRIRIWELPVSES